MTHILSVSLANRSYFTRVTLLYINLHAAAFIMQTKFATKREAQLRYIIQMINVLNDIIFALL